MLEIWRLHNFKDPLDNGSWESGIVPSFQWTIKSSNCQNGTHFCRALKGEDFLGNLLNNQNFLRDNGNWEIGIYLALFQVSILESHLLSDTLPPGKDYLSFVMSEITLSIRYHENIRLQIGPGHLISIPQYLNSKFKAQKLFMKLSKIVSIPIATDMLYQAKSYRRQNQRRTTQAVFLSPRVGLQYTYGYLSSHSATSNNSNCSPQNVAWSLIAFWLV